MRGIVIQEGYKISILGVRLDRETFKIGMHELESCSCSRVGLRKTFRMHFTFSTTATNWGAVRKFKIVRETFKSLGLSEHVFGGVSKSFVPNVIVRQIDQRW